MRVKLRVSVASAEVQNELRRSVQSGEEVEVSDYLAGFLVGSGQADLLGGPGQGAPATPSGSSQAPASPSAPTVDGTPQASPGAAPGRGIGPTGEAKAAETASRPDASARSPAASAASRAPAPARSGITERTGENAPKRKTDR